MSDLHEGGETTGELEYVTTPQNDKKQIEQIVTEYEGFPAKGLAHGIQKDAIQNGVGARLRGNEPKSYKNWRFTFELLKINGKYALAFWDEGTTGLTGEILDDEEIEKWSAEEKLTSEEKLSRFLTRFESGGNYGPGTFGRGKLIFQGGSDDFSILCDSLRCDDGRYIAFERKIIGNQLKQLKKPLVDKDAEKFIINSTGGVLKPLTSPGTRIVILNLKDEIIDAVKNSFNGSSSLEYLDTFVGMIEETWWEIIDKFNAKIFVKWNDEVKQVKLTEPLRSIARAKDGENGWRIYEKKHRTVVVDEMPYKIKELKFALSPEPLHEDFHEIWIQRKRMKIGSISRNIYVHHKIQRRLCGYLVLESELEDIIENGENTTHYSFNYGRKGLSQIREVLRTHLEAFQQELGLKTESEQAADRRDMLDTLNEINESASELGLLTDFSMGQRSKDVEISIKSFQLPNENSKTVEYNQPIGPIELKIKNNTSKTQFIRLFLNALQRGEGDQKEKGLYQEEIDLNPKEEKTVAIPGFEFEKDDFRYGEGVLIAAVVNSRKSGTKMCQVSRMVWLGREEPEHETPFKITAYRPLFPHPKTTRVELTDSIRNLVFKITNNTAFNAKLNVRIVVRKVKTDTADYITLKELKIDEGAEIGAMSDKEYSFEKVEISNEDFGWIFDTAPDHKERKCEIFISAKAAEHMPEINIIKKKTVGRKKIPFYLGMDPPGHTIFPNVSQVHDPKDHRRSYYRGSSATGYTFVLNTGHTSYSFAKDNGPEVKKYYIKEQMIRQAYIIAVKEGKFGGVLEEFEGSLTDSDTPPAELFMVMDEIIGKAFLELEA